MKDDFNPLSLSFRLDESRPMAPQDTRDADAYKDIGWLKGQLEALKDAVEANGIEARKGRERMYAEISATATGVSDLKSQVADVSDKVDGLSSRVEKTEARLTKYHDWSEQLKGSWKTIAVFWLIVGGVVAGFAKTISVKVFGIQW